MFLIRVFASKWYMGLKQYTRKVFYLIVGVCEVTVVLMWIKLVHLYVQIRHIMHTHARCWTMWPSEEGSLSFFFFSSSQQLSLTVMTYSWSFFPVASSENHVERDGRATSIERFCSQFKSIREALARLSNNVTLWLGLSVERCVSSNAKATQGRCKYIKRNLQGGLEWRCGFSLYFNWTFITSGKQKLIAWYKGPNTLVGSKPSMSVHCKVYEGLMSCSLHDLVEI